MDISFHEYDDVLVRRLVEKIVLNDNTIFDCLKNGEEIIEKLTI